MEDGLVQPKPIAEKITPLIQRQVEEEEEDDDEEEELLQTKDVPGQASEVTPDLESRINSIRGGGQPLPKADETFMEKRFGVDFSGVRVHTDSNAIQMNRKLNAQAFTLGRDIYFGTGRYSPNISSGKRLLVHELTHVSQQQSMKRTIRKFPADGAQCSGYQPGEISTSRTASGHLNPDVTLHAPDQLLIADFGVSRQNVKSSTQAEPLLISWLRTFESDNSYRLKIIGYTDCVGIDGSNTRIRHGRAEQVERLLGPGARSRVTFRGMAGLGSYVTNNNTVENRAKNRGVIIEFNQQAPTPPTPTPPEHPPEDVRICGPDVSAEVTRVWSRIQSDFHSWGFFQKEAACRHLIQPIIYKPGHSWSGFVINKNAFDTLGLFQGSAGWINKPPYHPPCAVPGAVPGSCKKHKTKHGKLFDPCYENPKTCSNTVKVGSDCWLSGTPNYGTFGIMMRLCWDWTSPLIFFPSWNIYHHAFSLPATILIVEAYKRLSGDDPVPPRRWAEATWLRGPGARVSGGNRPRCSPTCTVSYPNMTATGFGRRFDYVWEPAKPR
jgi:outer membrane protein OmpA-like peptidoglycan-associated protein